MRFKTKKINRFILKCEFTKRLLISLTIKTFYICFVNQKVQTSYCFVFLLPDLYKIYQNVF